MSVKTSGKEYFYSVSGLAVPRYMISDTLPEQLECFVKTSGAKTEKINSCLDSGRLDMFTAEMEDLYQLLCDIRAHQLEPEAAKILRLADINQIELCKKLIGTFIENVHMLVMSIKKAQESISSTVDHEEQNNKLAHYQDIIKNLKVIITLALNSEFEKAFDLAIATKGLKENELGMRFITNIASKNIPGLKAIAGELAAYYMKEVENFAAPQVPVMKKVLIVDDQPEILMALSHMLNKNYQVFAMPDGEQAMNFLRKNKHRVEAFILDIDMPNMSGFELAGCIRQKSEYEDTPILFLTSNSSKEAVMKAPLYNIKAFIVKPVNKDVILSKLEMCFN